MVKLILNKCDVNVNAKDDNDRTILHFVACRTDYFKLAKFLILENDTNIDEPDDDGVTPLYIACKSGNDRIVQLLIKNNADINFKKYNNKWTPLHVACKFTQVDVVRELLDNNAKVNIGDKENKTALHIVCENDNECENDNRNIVQLLIEHNADVNIITFDGETALQLAILNKHLPIVKYLLKQNPELDEDKKDFLLKIAQDVGSDEIIDLLNDNFKIIEEKNNESLRLINEIKKNNKKFRYDILNSISGGKVNLEYIDEYGWNALHWASYYNNYEVVKKLIEKGVNVKVRTKDGIKGNNKYKDLTAKEIADKRKNYKVSNLIGTAAAMETYNTSKPVLSVGMKIVKKFIPLPLE